MLFLVLQIKCINKNNVCIIRVGTCGCFFYFHQKYSINYKPLNVGYAIPFFWTDNILFKNSTIVSTTKHFNNRLIKNVSPRV